MLSKMKNLMFFDCVVPPVVDLSCTFVAPSLLVMMLLELTWVQQTRVLLLWRAR